MRFLVSRWQERGPLNPRCGLYRWQDSPRFYLHSRIARVTLKRSSDRCARSFVIQRPTQGSRSSKQRACSMAFQMSYTNSGSCKGLGEVKTTTLGLKYCLKHCVCMVNSRQTSFRNSAVLDFHCFGRLAPLVVAFPSWILGLPLRSCAETSVESS